MNLKILSLVIIGVCILLPDVCYAFLEKDVHLLNMQNGLADNTVSAVYKDKEGFVWFGTRNGLSRYDGRQITNFEQSNSYPSISNLKEAFDGVLAFVDNGVFSAFDLKKRTVFVCGFFFGTGYSISRDIAEERFVGLGDFRE